MPHGFRSAVRLVGSANGGYSLPVTEVMEAPTDHEGPRKRRSNPGDAERGSTSAGGWVTGGRGPHGEAAASPLAVSLCPGGSLALVQRRRRDGKEVDSFNTRRAAVRV